MLASLLAVLQPVISLNSDVSEVMHTWLRVRVRHFSEMQSEKKRDGFVCAYSLGTQGIDCAFLMLVVFIFLL